MRVFPVVKNLRVPIIAGALFAATAPHVAQSTKTPELWQDTFQTVVTIPPKGTSEKLVLAMAPNPEIVIVGEVKTAAIVVDLSKNVLYKYDETGVPEMAYLIASGKKRTPTDAGVRIVTHIERYPYKTAPEKTRRHRKPNDYGPRIICLEKLDPTTGKTSPTGEFIHGTSNPRTLGQYVSLGCMRMDNEVIKELSTNVKRGDIVIITGSCPE